MKAAVYGCYQGLFGPDNRHGSLWFAVVCGGHEDSEGGRKSKSIIIFRVITAEGQESYWHIVFSLLF